MLVFVRYRCGSKSSLEIRPGCRQRHGVPALFGAHDTLFTLEQQARHGKERVEVKEYYEQIREWVSYMYKHLDKYIDFTN